MTKLLAYVRQASFWAAVVFFVGLVTPLDAQSHGGPLAVGLRIENKIDPIGIDEKAPLVSWQITGVSSQQAYQIRAAHDLADLQKGKLLWDSGKVVSTAQNQIPLAAVQPVSRMSVTLQVRIWSQAGTVSPWSHPAHFEFGLLKKDDWSARWIENPDYHYTRPEGTEMPLPVFQRYFTVKGPVKSARLYVTGLGMYAPQMNGAPISGNVLEPGQTTYSAEVDYRTYDVASELNHGVNTLRLETGSGAYQRVPTPGRYFFGGGIEKAPIYGTPKVIAQLEITHADGSHEVIATNESWQTALGPTTFSSWWSGEEYDARRTDEAITWRGATLVQLTDKTTPRLATVLRADPRPPVEVMASLMPVKVRKLSDGSYLLDFGANHSGLPKFRLSGPAGATVSAQPIERLNSDGTPDPSTTGANAKMKIAYRYTFSGKGVETWRPQFTYNGFRYLKVEGLTLAPKPSEITADVVYASNPEASTFTSSDPLLQQIQEMTHRAIQSNMMSVFTDCPDREKGPYTGDNLQNIDALLTNYDLSSYEPQLVRNMATAQRQPRDEEPGLIANIAPEFHRVALVMALPPGMPKEMPPSKGNSAPRPPMPDFANINFLYEVNWGGAVIRIPWRLYRTYGDTRTMARYYDNMVAWMNFLAGVKAAHHGDIPGLGDWSAADSSTPLELPILAGYYSSLDELSKIAGVLGKSADQEKYAGEALKAAEEFNDRFRKTDNKGVYYGSGSEASNAMALDAGLVPEADRKDVLDRLIASVTAANNHITTGSVALGPLFRVLETSGHNDLLYKMVTNPTSPGYGYLAAAGFTTLAESLNGSGSNNHHFLGEVDAWLISGLAGIRQAPGSIGYREIEIVPDIVDGLTSANGSYATPFGVVRSEWTKSPQGAVRIQVDIPAGTTALVHVPVKPGGSAQATGQRASANVAERKDGEWIYRMTPGHMTFVSQWSARNGDVRKTGRSRVARLQNRIHLSHIHPVCRNSALILQTDRCRPSPLSIGMVCRHKRANKSTFNCPFHGWTFQNTGKLLKAKDSDGAGYPDSFNRNGSHDMKRVPRFESYKGFLFGSLNPDVVSLTEHLGEAAKIIDMIVDQSPDGLEVLRGSSSYIYDGNWKLQTENGADGYHVSSVHWNYAATTGRRKDSLEGDQVRAMDAGKWAKQGGFSLIGGTKRPGTAM